HKAALWAAVHRDGGAVGYLAAEHEPGELVADRALDEPAQRAGAVRRVVALEGEPLGRRRGDVERDPPLGEPVAQPRDLELDDRAELLERERVEDDDVVEPVEELRLER